MLDMLVILQCGGIFFQPMLVSSKHFVQSGPWGCVRKGYPWFSFKMEAGAGKQVSSHYQRYSLLFLGTITR